MKRILPLLLCMLAGAPLLICAAGTLSEAAALAAQQDAEERSKRLAADVQTLLDNQELLQKRQEEIRQRLDKLTDELRSLKEEQSRSSGNWVTRDDLRKYIEKLKEQLDEQRESDKKLILGNIKELARPPSAPPAEPRSPGHRTGESSEEPPFLYVVKKNDRLLDIIAEYNEYFQKHGLPKITMEQVLKANPGLKADHLISGKKIRIPVPAKDAK